MHGEGKAEPSAVQQGKSNLDMELGSSPIHGLCPFLMRRRGKCASEQQ